MNSIPRAKMDRLEFEAFKVLSGAEYVRQRLLHGLSMGTPSIESDAYLIKSRVKSAESLVLKVLERRKRKGKGDYSSSSVRDIVGLRILVLFKNEIPHLIGRILQFVEWSQQEPFSLFYGSEIGEAVAEIKIYPPSLDRDPSVDIYVGQFAMRGFRREIKNQSEDPSYLLPYIQVEDKDTEYSSIHVVLWANGPNRSLSDRVPVEVQIRTSLEDVWGEIDHRLRYKDRSNKQAGVGTSRKRSKVDEVDLVGAQLKSLKRHLDLSSADADILERRTKPGNEIEPIAGSYKKNSSYDIEKLLDLRLHIALQNKIRPTVDQLSAIYGKIHTLTKDCETSLLRGLMKGLSGCSSDLAEVLSIYLMNPLSDHEADAEVRYRILMERALCSYWRAVLLDVVQGLNVTPRDETELLHAVRESQSLYQEVGQIVGYANNSVLAFRMAGTHALLKAHETALDMFAEAYRQLENDVRLPGNHYMRLRIPRQYALALWLSAERTKLKFRGLGEAAFLLPRRREQYLQALDISIPLHGKKFDAAIHDWGSDSLEEESRISANNILEYAMCFIRTGGSLEVLAERMPLNDFKSHVDQVVGEGLESITADARADTVREAARILGDRRAAVDAAKRVLELIEAQALTAELPKEAYEEMRRDAENEIQIGDGVVPGYPLVW